MDTNEDREVIKSRLATANRSFFLGKSKNPEATYRIVWYKAKDKTKIKVDILTPGVMDIPSFPASQIERLKSTLDASFHGTVRGLPVAPLSVVLLLKLQAWSDHYNNPEWYFKKQARKDKKDLQYMVPLAAEKGITPTTDSSLNTEFLDAAQKRVLEYFKWNPSCSSRHGWRKMGFHVPDYTDTFARLSSKPHSVQSVKPPIKPYMSNEEIEEKLALIWNTMYQ